MFVTRARLRWRCAQGALMDIFGGGGGFFNAHPDRWVEGTMPVMWGQPWESALQTRREQVRQGWQTLSSHGCGRREATGFRDKRLQPWWVPLRFFACTAHGAPRTCLLREGPLDVLPEGPDGGPCRPANHGSDHRAPPPQPRPRPPHLPHRWRRRSRPAVRWASCGRSRPRPRAGRPAAGDALVSSRAPV
jgi:hypothetical protein